MLSSSQDKNNKSKVSYAAILLSWGINVSVDSATHLPYMLERGEQRISTAVKTTLQTIFDCQIKQFSFTQVFFLHSFALYYLHTFTSLLKFFAFVYLLSFPVRFFVLEIVSRLEINVDVDYINDQSPN